VEVPVRLVLALSLALVVACSDGGGATDDTDSDVVVGDPTLAFVHPTEDEQVSGGVSGAVDVELDVQNVSLVPRGMGTGVGVEGFILLTADDGNTAAQSEMNAKTTSMSGLFAGPHTLRAELVTPDGEPFDPAVVAEVSFDVVP
jgi:hypothetical protein